MSHNNRPLIQELVPLGVLAAFLLAVVFLTPDASRASGVSLFHEAQQTAWDKFADWDCAWCSLKIILLAMGAFMLGHICFTCVAHWITHKANWFILPLLLVAGGAFWFGLFYLFKAVL